jgi:hypothetical protein
MQRFFLPPVDQTTVPPATYATSVFSRILSVSFLAFVPIVSRLSPFAAPANILTAATNAALHLSLSTNHLLTPAFKPHST